MGKHAVTGADRTSHPTTPDPAVEQAVAYFLDGARRILGNHLAGIYLSGSLALGDFSPDRSDIDFVVATTGAISEATLAALQDLHARFNAGASPWAGEVEAAYIPLGALRRHDPAAARHPHIERGPQERLDWDDLAVDWVLQRHVLREHGVAVAGPPAYTLIDPIAPDELRRAAASLMDSWWGAMADDPTPLRHPGYQSYAVLTMCRILYTVECGAVVSKPAAAHRARADLGARWAPLIDAALDWRKDGTQVPGDVAATATLIRHTHERCREWSRSAAAPGAPPG